MPDYKEEKTKLTLKSRAIIVKLLLDVGKSLEDYEAMRGKNLYLKEEHYKELSEANKQLFRIAYEESLQDQIEEHEEDQIKKEAKDEEAQIKEETKDEKKYLRKNEAKDIDGMIAAELAKTNQPLENLQATFLEKYNKTADEAERSIIAKEYETAKQALLNPVVEGSEDSTILTDAQAAELATKANQGLNNEKLIAYNMGQQEDQAQLDVKHEIVDHKNLAHSAAGPKELVPFFEREDYKQLPGYIKGDELTKQKYEYFNSLFRAEALIKISKQNGGSIPTFKEMQTKGQYDSYKKIQLPSYENETLVGGPQQNILDEMGGR